MKENHKNYSSAWGSNAPGQPMSPEHPHWDDFLDRLDGSEGCNFHLAVPDDPASLTWTCNSGADYPFSRRILAEMHCTPDEIEASLSYFACHGGCCDCEVLLNAPPNAEDDV